MATVIYISGLNPFSNRETFKQDKFLKTINNKVLIPSQTGKHSNTFKMATVIYISKS